MTRALLDTCVLYPTVMREVLLAVAAQGLFQPLWSPRILEEWARAAARLGPEGQAQARAEIALLRSAWPHAETPPAPDGLSRRLYLPDENDIHVLACAIHASADLIVTQNARDFPRHVLAEEGLDRADADGFLYRMWLDNAAAVETACARVHARALQMDAVPKGLRALLKKARLPRLAKAVA